MDNLFNPRSKVKKVAIISDIHGNYPALKAVLEDIKHEDVEKIICLGDLVGFYCMINEVIKTIRDLNIETILGNHDRAIIKNKGVIERSKTCTSTLKRQLEYITDENYSFLARLKDNYKFKFFNKIYFCVHGGLNDFIDEYIGDVNEVYLDNNNFSYDVLISGHSHIPMIKSLSNHVYLNPGSVGQPRDQDKRASYLLISENKSSIKRVLYDINDIVKRMDKEGFDPYISEILYRGVRVGG